jgi:hypothetical protein
MENMNIFKIAAKEQLRFPFRGQISVEDLFYLNLNELDEVYRTLKKQVKDSVVDSLITDKETTDEDDMIAIKIQIVEEIFRDKKAEIEKERRTAENRIKAQKILEIMNRKQYRELEEMDLDELQAQLNALTEED